MGDAATAVPTIGANGSTTGPETMSAPATEPSPPAPVAAESVPAERFPTLPVETATEDLDAAPPHWVRSRALTFLCLLAGTYTLYFARAVLMPLTFGLILALLLRPVVRRLGRWRIPEEVAGGLALGTVSVVLGLATYYLVSPANDWLDSLPARMEIARDKLRPVLDRLSGLGDASAKMEDIAQGESSARPLEVAVRQPQLTSNFALLSVTGGYLASLVVTLTSAYFLLCHGDRLLSNSLGLVSTFGGKRNVVELVVKVQNSVSSYLFTVTAINTGLGVAIGTTLWLMGLPNPALWGLLAGALNFIPYAGALATFGIVFFVALLQSDSLGAAAIAPLACGAINAIEGNFVTPTLLGRSMSLNPLVVVFALAFWGWMWGIGGALLAVPLLAVLKAALDQFEETQPLGALLGS